MRLVKNKPWWWFITGRAWKNIAMTWGKTIYLSPEADRPDIIAHEMEHIRQNGGKWYVSFWFLVRSTFDEKFYEKLESEARRAQLRYILHENNRNRSSRP